MKVLILNGSPHVHGTTATALAEAERTLIECGIECETVQVGNRQISGCVGCGACHKGHNGCIHDPLVNVVAKKFEEADGIIIGSPVYYASPNGTLIAFLDKLFYSAPFDKSMKVGAAVVCARRGGCTASFDVINKYFSISSMPIATSCYWNQVHGAVAEDAPLDEEGMMTMRTLAKNMAFLIKSISLGKEKFGLPEKEPKTRTNFIKR
ncbi:MAG: flavodoxin family protein [Clostridia bacterium]|nr:flavodoxin family protein [Clostridia bacterium]